MGESSGRGGLEGYSARRLSAGRKSGFTPQMANSGR
jgi:hypothetical protein